MDIGFDWQQVDGFVEDLVRVLVALACGVLLGVEREWRDRPAGLRTICLTTMGSCLFMIVGNTIIENFAGDHPDLRIDPGRLPSYVVAGIGFLGAGCIMHQQGGVRGLTTAATIWLGAGVGLLAGLDRFALAGSATVLAFVALSALRPLGRRLSGPSHGGAITICCRDDPLLTRLVQHHLNNFNYAKDVRWQRRDDRMLVHFEYLCPDDHAIDLLERLNALEGVEGCAQHPSEYDVRR